MKKRTTLFGILLCVGIGVFGQSNVLKFEEFKLSNGLTVYLNEDHTQPNVSGAVIVRGGSKCDPQDATGIAHYFEHIMFKGTDKIGTVDYTSEKVFLDSIQALYDKLPSAKDELARTEIQKHINRLSIKAAEFAIPNEFNTVFRLFQSELETVYEEKNMGEDNFFRRFQEYYMSQSFKNTPYEIPVIGKTEHLKNPSITKMMEYYNKYYIANNMALVLSGNFNSKEIRPIIEQKFGQWKSGPTPVMPEIKRVPFKGKEVVKCRYSPIRLGIIAFQGIADNNPDNISLELCTSLLSNGNSGLLDTKNQDGKIMYCGVQNQNLAKAGDIMCIFVPKIIGQSMESAEKVVLDEIEKLKKGDFDDSLLFAVKNVLKKQFYQKLENMQYRPYFAIDVFINGITWDEYFKYPEKIDKITKEDIKRIANKYFTENFLVMESRTGFPKKHKLTKPGFDPIVPKNKDAKSEYAKMLANLPSKKEIPQYIEFNPTSGAKLDVQVEEVKSKVTVFHSANPINKIFNLNITFQQSGKSMPLLPYAASYVDNLGSTTMTKKQFSIALQKLGANVNFYAGDNGLSIGISGLDENFTATINLINQFVANIKGDETKMKRFIDDTKGSRKMEDKTPDNELSALTEYMLYKNKSQYIDRLTLKETKELKSDSLLKVFHNAFKYEAVINYSGTISKDEVCKTIKDCPMFANVSTANNIIYDQPTEKYNEPIVFFVDDKKAIQSQILFWEPTVPTDEYTRTYNQVFNKYFGHDMDGLVFQEIREFRSLAYGTWGNYSNAFKVGNVGSMELGLSTQADKTNEAVGVAYDLLTKMPMHKERIDAIKNAMLRSINASRSNFRSWGYMVKSWRNQGFNDDPRKLFYPKYETLSFDDVENFYKKTIEGRKPIICIVGDKKRINLKDLEKYGKVVELKTTDIFKK